MVARGELMMPNVSTAYAQSGMGTTKGKWQEKKKRKEKKRNIIRKDTINISLIVAKRLETSLDMTTSDDIRH